MVRADAPHRKNFESVRGSSEIFLTFSSKIKISLGILGLAPQEIQYISAPAYRSIVIPEKVVNIESTPLLRKGLVI